MIFSISLIFTIVGLVTFDLSVQEIKKFLGSRNEGFAFNMIQGLDKHIANRVLDFQELTNLSLIQDSLIDSNKRFDKVPDIESYLKIKEDAIEFTESTPTIGGQVDEVLTQELIDTIDFYHDEYNFDVIEELFVTNAYGANVALATGNSDYFQSDEEWWQIAKNTGSYVGKIQYDEIYDSYSIAFAFRVNDVDENFIGVLRVLINLNDILSTFIEESDIITIPGRSVSLLNEIGNPIYLDKQISVSDNVIPYFENLIQGQDSGFFELADNVDNLRLVSYAKSTGYKAFEGFDWVVIVEQDSSSIVQEFIELRNSILAVSVLGMIASIVGGFLISNLVSTPLKLLSGVANSISKGNFDVNIKASKIDEIKTISNSFEDMAKNLDKLIETEKQLAEANIQIKYERLSAIGELAASMAHDMKNPLATITSSAHILQKNTNQNEELQEVVNRMNRAIDRMTHQINDVLNYIRITPLELKSIKITQLLHLAKSSLEIPNNISFSIQDSNVEIKCDVRKLEIVFINIFLNSIQAIGKNDGKIQCSIEQKDSTAIIEVQDSGPGIPDEFFSKIFEPLVTSKQKGTGLGLSTCKNVIEQHNGTITCINNPTRFTIILPVSF